MKLKKVEKKDFAEFIKFILNGEGFYVYPQLDLDKLNDKDLMYIHTATCAVSFAQDRLHEAILMVLMGEEDEDV